MTAAEIAEVEEDIAVLTSVEEARRDELEEEITGAFADVAASFVRAGAALTEIRDSKLYKATHRDFGAYIEDRWNISRPRGYQLIEGARIAGVLSTAGIQTASERQIRPLSGLNDPAILDAWETASVDTMGRPSAAALADARSRQTPAWGASAPEAGRTDRSGADAPDLPKARRRAPLGDSFKHALGEATRKATTLANLVRDDRWQANVDSLRGGARSDLGRLIESLQQVYDALSVVEGQTLPGLVTGANLAPVSSKSTRKPITVTRGSKGTSYVGYDYAVGQAIERLQIRAMPDTNRKNKRRAIPTSRLDDLCAALEADGHLVEVVVE
ncbi:hypothetical protein [Jatrophihabitans sp.]|uniref:hypothetical protein n=1 Tax=Jatrophihabitans sp. TaxID=1932789 RepID=UPI0030C6932C|nr:hypothetical protein [Jatrophihabitans sp.]